MAGESNSDKCIMVIGAHAADAEIMGGASVLKHVDAGWRAVMVHMTPGEKGHPKLSPEEYKKIKDVEAENAAKVLGAKSIMMPWPDGELPVNEEVQMAIADVIRERKPTIILTHWKGSFHRDHNNTHHNVLASLFFAGLKTFVRTHPPHHVQRIYFAENWEDMERFRPEVYLDTTVVFDRYEQSYLGASRMRGAEAGFDQAVTLMPHKSYYGSWTTVDLLEPGK